MHFKIILCIAVGLFSCEKKKENSSEPEGAQTPKVTISADQPVIPDPSAGSADVPVDNDIPIDNDEDPQTESPEPAFTDFRPDATTTYSIPTNFLSIDPRSFVPTGGYQQGASSLTLDFSKSNILVPHDG